MSYLSRESAPLSDELWKKIDDTVVSAARRVLTGRRFLHIYGPLGIGTASVAVDRSDTLAQKEKDGLIVTEGRRYVEIPVLHQDFELFARDLAADGPDAPAGLSRVKKAAEACARKEDALIYFGSEQAGYEGLLTAKGVGKLPKKDWAAGENAFADVSAAITQMMKQDIYGDYTLVLSPDLYLQLQRIQPGTGLLEADRIGKLLNGRLFLVPALGTGKAALICAEPENVDLVVGQDLSTAYLEQKDLNHRFRVLESVLPRVKRAEAVVLFG